MAINPVEIIIKAKDEASGIFSSIGSKVAAVGASIAAYLGINAFVGAVKGAADLEAKLSEVQAVSGATAAEMVLLRQAAEEAGATTKFTATEGADALGNLTRAGVSAKDAIAALPAVLQLAQAGGIGLAEASDYVTKTIMGMGLSFADAGRVADVLAMGANASNTSVTGLAQAMSYAAPLANTLGLDLETTVAIIGKFADAGIDASRAGTALNAIMAQFADPASIFRTELANAGITTTNFEQALRQLAAAGPAGSKAINAVGTEAGPALRALLNQGIGALDVLKGKLDGAAGSAATTAAVMENNLNGAFSGLSSAWDTVKNALATPVLPVLTQGMNDLATAFRSAVDNGTIAKFGAVITTQFEGAIKWVKAFAAEVDFTALAAQMQAFATSTQDTFTKIGEYATNAGNIVKSVYGVMSSGVNAVLVVVYGLGEAFAGVASNIQRGLALLLQGLAKITFGDLSASFKKAADEIKLSAEASWAASEAFAKKGQQAFIDMSNGAELARDGWDGLTAGTAAASAQANASTPAINAMAGALTDAGDAAQQAGNKIADSGTKQQVAATEAKEKVAALRAEYEAAVAAGNWQLAAEKMQALRDAAKDAKTGTADLKKQAEQDAAAIAASFARMGIKTTAELTTMATTSKQDFDRIQKSGQATAEGLQTAFKKYATDAIAANGGVATEALKSEAAMRGLQITTDGAGRSIVQAMAPASDAVRQLGTEADAAAKKIDKLKDKDPFAGFTKTNRDGGTGTNTLPIDKIWALREKTRQGQKFDMTQAEFDEAKKQADNSARWISESGMASPQAIADARDLQRALQSTLINITDRPEEDQELRRLMNQGYTEGQAKKLIEDSKKSAADKTTDKTSATQASTTPSTSPGPQATGKTYTVNVTINGQNTPVNVSSESDAQALINALKRAQQTAG